MVAHTDRRWIRARRPTFQFFGDSLVDNDLGKIEIREKRLEDPLYYFGKRATRPRGALVPRWRKPGLPRSPNPDAGWLHRSARILAAGDPHSLSHALHFPGPEELPGVPHLLGPQSAELRAEPADDASASTTAAGKNVELVIRGIDIKVRCTIGQPLARDVPIPPNARHVHLLTSAHALRRADLSCSRTLGSKYCQALVITSFRTGLGSLALGNNDKNSIRSAASLGASSS
jgi:hypothetical protein